MISTWSEHTWGLARQTQNKIQQGRKMNYAKTNVESPGIDPGASRMLSERSTIWASLPLPSCTIGHRLEIIIETSFSPISYSRKFLNKTSPCVFDQWTFSDNFRVELPDLRRRWAKTWIFFSKISWQWHSKWSHNVVSGVVKLANIESVTRCIWILKKIKSCR